MQRTAASAPSVRRIDLFVENAVFGLMVGLIAAGVVLFFAAPILARAIVGREGDPVGTTRVIQVVAVVMLVGALFLRPHSDETAAFPPPPDSPIDPAR